jgi:hypothetical protein
MLYPYINTTSNLLPLDLKYNITEVKINTVNEMNWKVTL